MAHLSFTPIDSQFTTPVPDSFITDKMLSASATMIKVYLYVLYAYQKKLEDFTFASVAEKLDILESDVLKALQYWDEKDLLTLVHDPSSDNWSVLFASHASVPPKGQEPLPDREASASVQGADSKIIRVEQKPTYSPEEMACYKNDPKIAHLFEESQKILGGPVSSANLSTLFSFYAYYRLPCDVILYMLSYCASNGHRELRYIEKVAQDWSDHGIKTVDQAKDHVATFTKWRPILRALHESRLEPTDEQLIYFRRFLEEYQMPMELVLNAAERTYDNVGRANLNYMDSILKNWYSQGIRTLKAVEAEDARFQNSRQSGRKTASAGSLNNFKSSFDDQDLDLLKKQALDRTFDERSQS